MSDIVKEANFGHKDEFMREFAYLRAIIGEIVQDIEYRKSCYKFTTKVDKQGRSVYQINLAKADRKIRNVDFFYSKWAKRLRKKPFGRLRLDFIKEIKKDIQFIVNEYGKYMGL